MINRPMINRHRWPLAVRCAVAASLVLAPLALPASHAEAAVPHTTLPAQSAASRPAPTTAAVAATTPATVRNITVTAAVITADTTRPVVVRGRLAGFRTGEKVGIDVLSAGRWQRVATSAVDAAGRFSATETHGAGTLGTYRFRARELARPTSTVGFRVAMGAYPDYTTQAVTAAMVPRTYQPGCPVTPVLLTRLGMNYYGFDHRVHRGYLIVRSTRVRNFENAFAVALDTRFPIRQMRDPSVYGSDAVSMVHDNTYAFYCRLMSGSTRSMSRHSLGTAVDINTVENPYHAPDGSWQPAAGRPYADRHNVRPGMLVANSPVTLAFERNGFTWLGSAAVGAYDCQHFEIR